MRIITSSQEACFKACYSIIRERFKNAVFTAVRGDVQHDKWIAERRSSHDVVVGKADRLNILS